MLFRSPTLRGVGITSANNKIEIDRFSSKSNTGTSIAFLDSLNAFNGWKTTLVTKGAWVNYNNVDFGNKKIKSVEVRAKSENNGTVQLHLDKIDGPVVAEICIPKGIDWKLIDAKVTRVPKGLYNLFVVLKDTPVEIDWVIFKN